MKKKIFTNEKEEKAFETSLLPSILINFAKDNLKLSLAECIEEFYKNLDKNWNKYSVEWKISYMSFAIEDISSPSIENELTQNKKKRKNQKVKSIGNRRRNIIL